ncbi:MAG TPA: methionyl-tRNA formyltransferase, partial [Bacteroidia bacterium]|nr:methionyl-tRNA formyltransferase [Bacteroidia bacterium]
KENTRLSTALPVASQFNFVRGLSPYPAAHGEFFRLSDQRSIPVKLFQVRASPDDKSHLSGKLLVQDKEKLFIEGPDGLLEILELQPAGKGRMKARDFLNGNRLEGEWTFR